MWPKWHWKGEGFSFLIRNYKKKEVWVSSQWKKPLPLKPTVLIGWLAFAFLQVSGNKCHLCNAAAAANRWRIRPLLVPCENAVSLLCKGITLLFLAGDHLVILSSQCTVVCLSAEPLLTNTRNADAVWHFIPPCQIKCCMWMRTNLVTEFMHTVHTSFGNIFVKHEVWKGKKKNVNSVTTYLGSLYHGNHCFLSFSFCLISAQAWLQTCMQACFQDCWTFLCIPARCWEYGL